MWGVLECTVLFSVVKAAAFCGLILSVFPQQEQLHRLGLAFAAGRLAAGQHFAPHGVRQSVSGQGSITESTEARASSGWRGTTVASC